MDPWAPILSTQARDRMPLTWLEIGAQQPTHQQPTDTANAAGGQAQRAHVTANGVVVLPLPPMQRPMPSTYRTAGAAAETTAVQGEDTVQPKRRRRDPSAQPLLLHPVVKSSVRPATAGPQASGRWPSN